MVDRHDVRHEEQLTLLLTGDVPPSEAEVLLESCAECRQRYRELAGLASNLVDLSEGARSSVLDEARDLPPLEMEASVVGTLQEAMQAGTENREASARPRPWGWVPLAAAVLIAGVFLWGLLGDNDEPGSGEPGAVPGGFYLGGGGFELLPPRAAGGAFSSFMWNSAAPPGGWFEILIYDEGSGGDTPLIRHTDLAEPRWEATEEAKLEGVNQIRWEVRVYDASGELVDSAWARSGLSSLESH